MPDMWAVIARHSLKATQCPTVTRLFPLGVEFASKATSLGQLAGFEKPFRDAIMTFKVVDWNQIREDVFPRILAESYYNFNGSFETAVFMSLTEPENLDRLRQFVLHIGYKNLNSTLLAKYMALSNDSEEILRCWKVISSRSTVFPQNDLNHIISGLLKTAEWRLAFELVSKKEAGSDEQKPISYALLRKLFEMEYDDYAYKYMDSFLPNVTVSNFIEPCMEEPKRAERLLQYMKRNELFLARNIKPDESKSWQTLFRPKQVHIDNSSRCPECKRALPVGHLTDEEFSKLRAFALDLVMKQGDIYLSSSPEELRSFTEFMKTKGPFDVTIDGLNLAYSGFFRGKKIDSICQLYIKLGFTRILIIMRKHILNLFKGLHLPSGVTFYSVQNSSKDDPYLLLAALESHKRCRVLSGDFFRDHLSKMRLTCADSSNSDASKLFMKWLTTRKDVLIDSRAEHDHSKGTTFGLALAPKHFIQPYNDKRGWHIPLKFKPGDRQQWICLRYRNT